MRVNTVSIPIYQYQSSKKWQQSSIVLLVRILVDNSKQFRIKFDLADHMGDLKFVLHISQLA